jgi:hypothetical protein
MEKIQTLIETVETPIQEQQELNTQESLPSLSSIFKPEEFFGLNPIEEVALSVMCCFTE